MNKSKKIHERKNYIVRCSISPIDKNKKRSDQCSTWKWKTIQKTYIIKIFNENAKKIDVDKTKKV